MEFFSNPLHLMLLIVVIVLLFGANKIGDVGGALGKSIREFKKEAGKDEEPHAARMQVPPTTGYIPPAVQSVNHQPEVTAAPPVYVPVEPVRRAEPVPGDYRPSSTAPAQPSAGTVPPDFSGR